MNDWYFYLENGKTKGPFEKSDVEKAISRGTLGPFDLLYREGTEKWQPIHQFKDFKSLFKSQIKAEIDDSWVVLVRREGHSGEGGRSISYLQRGPFATAKVKQLLETGEIRYRDFIWREGNSQWSRISSVDSFAPAPPIEWKPEHLLPQDVDVEDRRSKAEVLKEVVKQRKPEVRRDEPPPPEVDPEDLLDIADEPPPSPAKANLRAEHDAGRTTGRVIPDPEPIPELRPLKSTVPEIESRPAEQKRDTAAANVNRSTRTQKIEEKAFTFALPIPTERRIPLLYIAVALASLVVIVVLLANRHEILQMIHAKTETLLEDETLPTAPKIAEKAKPKKEPVKAESPSEPVAAPAPAPSAPAAPPPPESPRVEPTRLKVRVNDPGTSRAALVFDTDGSHHFPIRVKITGAAGDVLGAVSVWRDQTVNKTRDGVAKLELASLDLGEGPYRLNATMKDVDSELSFRIGREDKEFRAKLDKHRKLISLPYQRERRRLIRASLELQNISRTVAKNGMRGMNEAISKWNDSQLEGLNVNSPRNLVFPMAWQELIDVRNDLKSSANEAKANEFRKAQERLRHQVERALEESLYR